MSWTKSIGEVDIYWHKDDRNWGYVLSPAYHRLHPIPGLTICWPRRDTHIRGMHLHTRIEHKREAVVAFVVRCTVAISIGVVLGFVLRLLLLP